MKILSLTLLAVFLMGSVALAGNTEEWLKGNDVEDPLEVSLYVAKTFKAKDEKSPDIRIKIERQNDIGSFDDATTIASIGLEF